MDGGNNDQRNLIIMMAAVAIGVFFLMSWFFKKPAPPPTKPLPPSEYQLDASRTVGSLLVAAESPYPNITVKQIDAAKSALLALRVTSGMQQAHLQIILMLDQLRADVVTQKGVSPALQERIRALIKTYPWLAP